MSFFEQLESETQQNRSYLLESPLIKKALNSQIVINEYLNFLIQAYHHVKHTVPLLMATGSRLSDDKEWLREAIAEYIEEELGHQEWILNDIAACGVDKELARNSRANFATQMMVAYAYDHIHRINPLGFFGMVHVLEGTSIAVADTAADKIKSTLNLPKKAFSYLYSHGSLDQEHVVFFKELMNKITSQQEQKIIINAANNFYILYANIFRSIDSGSIDFGEQ